MTACRSILTRSTTAHRFVAWVVMRARRRRMNRTMLSRGWRPGSGSRASEGSPAASPDWAGRARRTRRRSPDSPQAFIARGWSKNSAPNSSAFVASRRSPRSPGSRHLDGINAPQLRRLGKLPDFSSHIAFVARGPAKTVENRGQWTAIRADVHLAGRVASTGSISARWTNMGGTGQRRPR